MSTLKNLNYSMSLTIKLFEEKVKPHILSQLKILVSLLKEQIFIEKESKKGIPQGTSISAVLANVYMIDFDKKVCALLKNLGGMYRRYSDDFIIVIPKEKVNRLEFSNIFKKLLA
jgi:Reverse transcriptase (RNA-dependent DNA polymerase).